MSASKRLIPLLNRIVVEKMVQPNKTVGGIMLPESAMSKVCAGVREHGVPHRERYHKPHALAFTTCL